MADPATMQLSLVFQKTLAPDKVQRYNLRRVEGSRVCYAKSFFGTMMITGDHPAGRVGAQGLDSPAWLQHPSAAGEGGTQEGHKQWADLWQQPYVRSIHNTPHKFSLSKHRFPSLHAAGGDHLCGYSCAPGSCRQLQEPHQVSLGAYNDPMKEVKPPRLLQRPRMVLLFMQAYTTK